MNMISCKKEDHIAILSVGKMDSGEGFFEQLVQELDVIDGDSGVYVLVIWGEDLSSVEELLGGQKAEALSKKIEKLAVPVLVASEVELPETYLGCDIVICSQESKKEAVRMAQLIEANAPIAVQQIKRCVNHGIEFGQAAGLSYELQAFSLCHSTKDKVIGMRALQNNESEKIFLNQ